MHSLKRTRNELGEFLKACRARLTPADVGLPNGSRRRTPGLRREEVAALSGVGLTWYTWLEQGRDIGVSSNFLESLARALKLDAAERRHLFLLAHARPPSEPGRTWCVVPPLILRLMRDLRPHAAYVLNLRWDVLAFNGPAAQLFGFEDYPPERRNLLWMLFVDQKLRERVIAWEEQSQHMLSSFRRDFANATHETDIHALVNELKHVSPEFRHLWERHAVQMPRERTLELQVNGEALLFEHTSLTIDAERHLRLVVFARQ
ncbi:MAG: helix-turn-helix transcriptional regulator [Rhodocyclaceae bacterium]